MDDVVRQGAAAESAAPVASADAHFGKLTTVKRWVRSNIIFTLTVLAPTFLASLYFGLIASDVYVSESRFVVRSPEQQRSQSGVVGALLQSTGISRAPDDTYSVRDFILSRDALRELDEKLGIRKLYSSALVDVFRRFPDWDWDRSFEALYRYYGKYITVEYDPESSISVLTVRAFSARDARNINQLLLEMSERLINSLNDRSRHDLVHFAEEEVRVAAEHARDASLAMLAYRKKQAIYEPDKQAEIQLEGVAKLQGELVDTEAQLAEVKRLSPNNPQISGLNSRAETLRNAIMAEAAKVTDGKGSISARSPVFERLALDSDYADKELGIALETLQTARNEAARKQLYLDRLVQPNLQDKAMEPRRVRSVFTVFVFGLIAWGVASLIVAAVREHVD
jgi:capsular polysaccharide transport system permease protein